MANKYVDFISDEHLLGCIKNLYESYVKAKSDVTKKKFYKNKIDTFKLTFDSKFNDLDEKAIIKSEMIRQIDKSINNSIGTFHEQVLGGIDGYETGVLTGYDVKANDNTLFAEVKNKHNTMSSSAAEAAFQRLARFADDNRSAKCYLVQILAKKSFKEKWEAIINGKEYSHSRVYKISGDQFYFLLTGQETAFFDLYQALPKALKDFLGEQEEVEATENSALSDIESQTEASGRSIFNEITFENYSYYLGFDKL
ncbi:Eco47II family restriction endonuclease [Cytophagaceae bacterium ABcell3]|nr:Eco47II family restriction endonuclease [Cytophagaceae bacterium ABcell3]